MKFVTIKEYCSEWRCNRSTVFHMIRTKCMPTVKGQLVDIDTPPISVAKKYTGANFYSQNSRMSKLSREKRIEVLAQKLNDLKSRRKEMEQQSDIKDTVIESLNREIESVAKRLVAEQMDI